MTEPTAAPAPATETNAAPAPEPSMGDALLSAAKDRGDLKPDAPANDTAPEAEGEKAEAAPEKPKEPEKPQERDTALFRAALKEREKATQIREEAIRTKQEAERRASEVSKLQQELAAEREKFATIKSDPLKFFELFGVDPNDFARHLMAWNEKKPEERARDKQLETMAEKLERLEREKQQLEERQKAEHVDRLVANAKDKFWEHVETGAKSYPHLAVGDKDDIVDVFWDLAKRHYDNTGQHPTFEMVANHLEGVAAEKAARIEARRKQLLGATVSEPVTETQRQTSPTANGAPPRSPTTLTNAASATRATPPKQMTEDEQREWAAELLRRSFG